MSVVSLPSDGKITVPKLLQRKQAADLHIARSGFVSTNPETRKQKITCLTAYDYPTTRLLDEAGVDVLLVGDSLAMVVLGHESTLPVTIDALLHHTRAVRPVTTRRPAGADRP